MIGKWENKGFSLASAAEGQDKEDANAILVDPLFLKAKKGDAACAKMLWKREWNRNAVLNEERLAAALEPGKTPVFISVPGTSRQNQIPPTAVAWLSEKVGRHALYLNGDRYFMPLHNSMMKTIAKGERVFHPRVFQAMPGVFERIQKAVPNAQFFVVEDMLTTGNSAHSFQRFLAKNGLFVSGMIAMKGEYEAIVHPNLVKKIDKFFKKNGIAVDANAFCAELTGKEAQTIAFQTTAIYQNADDEHRVLLKNLFEKVADVKVNGNIQLLPETEKAAWQLSQYLEQKKQKGKEKEHGQVQIENSQTHLASKSISAILQTAAQNPAGGRSTSHLNRKAADGNYASENGVRDNKNNQQSAGNPVRKTGSGTVTFDRDGGR